LQERLSKNVNNNKQEAKATKQQKQKDSKNSPEFLQLNKTIRGCNEFTRLGITANVS
jgi:hypothetical protein